jgi:D-alanine--poly(phosphoribitol) ligase subunit 2
VLSCSPYAWPAKQSTHILLEFPAGLAVHKNADGIILQRFAPRGRKVLISETVLKELERFTGTDQVRRDLDTDLFGHKLLDSLATVELTIALSEDFGLELSPSDIDREMWATPQKIIDYFQKRTGRA